MRGIPPPPPSLPPTAVKVAAAAKLLCSGRGPLLYPGWRGNLKNKTDNFICNFVAVAGVSCMGLLMKNISKIFFDELSSFHSK
jgi:hypothetical protein